MEVQPLLPYVKPVAPRRKIVSLDFFEKDMKTLLPDIYLFNPTCDYAVANGRPSWQPNSLLQKMEDDLATLPMFFCRHQDYVLVRQIPSACFTEQFAGLKFKMPKFILKDAALRDPVFLSGSYGKILPWGWSPAAHKLLAPLKASCSAEFLNSPIASWSMEHREMYSRKTALQILSLLSDKLPPEITIRESCYPAICAEQKQIEQCIARWGKVMIKAPWSSSGRGLQPISKLPVHQKVWEKIHGLIRDQGYVMTEPLLNKVFDLAFLFKAEKGNISLTGISYFMTDKKGRYLGNLLNGLPEDVAPEISSFVHLAIHDIPTRIIPILENSTPARLHEGHFGVDTLSYRDMDHKLRINPCLEINVRYTMGHLAVLLEKMIHPEKKGQFRIFYHPGQSFLYYKKEMEEKFPPIFVENKLYSGFLPLTEAGENSVFGAFMIV